MKKTVVLNHLGTWYKAYGDSAKIISFLMDYKLFEDNRSLAPTVGFPETSIIQVTNLLHKNKINYILRYDDDKVVDFGEENNFDKFLHDDLPFSYVVASGPKNKKVEGSFKVQYEGEDVEEYIIGTDINQETELVKKVLDANVGETIKINEFNILVIEKNIH